jgi:hypothetical protein
MEIGDSCLDGAEAGPGRASRTTVGTCKFHALGTEAVQRAIASDEGTNIVQKRLFRSPRRTTTGPICAGSNLVRLFLAGRGELSFL